MKLNLISSCISVKVNILILDTHTYCNGLDIVADPDIYELCQSAKLWQAKEIVFTRKYLRGELKNQRCIVQEVL